MHDGCSRSGSWLVVLVLGVALVAGCDKSGKNGGADAASALPVVTAAAGAGLWTVRQADGAEAVSIRLDGGKVTIGFGGKTITGQGAGGKRRYLLDGAPVAIAKVDGEKIKLKDDAGKLLWKIKLTAEKVKISSQEEGDDANAYSIKPKDDGFKVKRGESELGKVKVGGGKIKVKDAAGNAVFEGQAENGSALWGVLLLGDIPEAERYVIMAEIGAAGR